MLIFLALGDPFSLLVYEQMSGYYQPLNSSLYRTMFELVLHNYWQIHISLLVVQQSWPLEDKWQDALYVEDDGCSCSNK
jgi:hypothetical protein